jgi:hypothetical protein
MVAARNSAGTRLPVLRDRWSARRQRGAGSGRAVTAAALARVSGVVVIGAGRRREAGWVGAGRRDRLPDLPPGRLGRHTARTTSVGRGVRARFAVPSVHTAEPDRGRHRTPLGELRQRTVGHRGHRQERFGSCVSLHMFPRVMRRIMVAMAAQRMTASAVSACVRGHGSAPTAGEPGEVALDRPIVRASAKSGYRGRRFTRNPHEVTVSHDSVCVTRNLRGKNS